MAGWLTGLGQVTDAGVEGTGSYGYRLARLLSDRGVQVWEINCPDRSRRRRKGKATRSMPKTPPGRSWPVRPPRYPRTAAAWSASCGCCC